MNSNPASSSSKPRQYFQSTRPRTASAACRSVRSSQNCSTVTIASCAGLIPGLPRTGYAAAKSASSYHEPSSSRIRMASDPPLRNALFATRAVSSGTSGHGFGCIDTMTRFCGRIRGQGTGRPQQTIVTSTTTGLHDITQPVTEASPN